MPLPSYHRFAEAYDWEGSIDFSRQAFRRLMAICREYGIAPGWHLDLGCGTGTLAILTAEAGWKVIGLDLSEAMLAQARRKAAEAGRKIWFVRQDMRQLRVAEPVKLVTSFYDTLNHLSSGTGRERRSAGISKLPVCVQSGRRPSIHFPCPAVGT